MTSRISSYLRNAQIVPLILTTGAGWSTRFATAAAQFVAIRLLTDRLNADGYGAFAVISGLLAWFMLADLGFGSAIQNHISKARVDGEEWHAVVFRVLRRLSVILMGIWVLVAAVAPWAGPYLLAGYPRISTVEATIAFAIFGILLSATGALSIILKVQFAEHRGYIAHLVTGLAAIAGLALLAVVLSLSIDHLLVWSILAYYFPGVFFPIVLLVWMGRSRESSAAHATIPLDLKKQARVFLIFAILSAAILNVDYIILSRTVSPHELLTYAIISKAYALIYVLYNSILQAYWPISAEAMNRGDAAMVRQSIRRCIAAGAAIVVGGTLFLILGIDRIALLLAPSEHPVVPPFLIALFALYWLLRVWTDVFGVIIMSSGQVGYLCRIVPIQALVSVPCAYLGAKFFGVAGLMVGLSVGYVSTVAWMMPRHIILHLKTMSGTPA